MTLYGKSLDPGVQDTIHVMEVTEQTVDESSEIAGTFDVATEFRVDHTLFEKSFDLALVIEQAPFPNETFFLHVRIENSKIKYVFK